ncbi:glycoside hydrolase domain-containing protein [Streptomyces sp. NPDC020965]|uniref:DUF1906 domain-containing protein n=1 Tax=Streptomyces sp. NPDC020965 TaxID=3365105 RepID=UPI00378E1529
MRIWRGVRRGSWRRTPAGQGSGAVVRRRSSVAVALALTVLLGLPELLLAPPPERAPTGTPHATTARTDTGTHPDPHPHPDTGTHPDTRTHPDTPTRPDTGAETRPGTDTRPDTRPDTTADTAVTFHGLVFDACRAPRLAAMRAWRASSLYGAIGVPYGGRGRDCPDQPGLDRRWIAEVHRMGWRVLPIFVGSQSPCALTDRSPRAAPIGATPALQGEREGYEAIARGRVLGLGRGSALYLGLRAYDLGNTGCVRATLDFIRAWDREVRRRGYVPGLHSDADSGARHMERARREGASDLPSVLWFTRWTGRPSLHGEESLHPYAWRAKRRIHQYGGPATERYGGHALTVARSLADAPVAVVDPEDERSGPGKSRRRSRPHRCPPYPERALSGPREDPRP